MDEQWVAPCYTYKKENKTFLIYKEIQRDLGKVIYD